MATYYVDMAVGGDGNLGTSEGAGNAWQTIDKAMNTVAAGDIVYVKASANYTETAVIDTAGVNGAPILFVGYSATANRTDRGKATIDGGSVRANCLIDSLGAVEGYYVFENFIFENGTNHGIVLSVNQVVFRNCELNNNGGLGINSNGSGQMCESCIFSGNSNDGFEGNTSCALYGCRFLSNTSEGARMVYGSVWGSTFYNNGDNAIQFTGSNGLACSVVNCTVDGNAKNTSVAVQFPAAAWGPYAVINTILYDCSTGIDGHDNGGGRFIGRNNLVNSNTANYGNTGYETLVGEQTGAPVFTNEGSQDYTLGSGSPATNAGFDGYETAGATQRADIGAHESSAGGLLVHPGTSGGARG